MEGDGNIKNGEGKARGGRKEHLGRALWGSGDLKHVGKDLSSP